MLRETNGPARTLSLEGNLNVFSIQRQWKRVQALLALESGEAELDLSLVSDLDEIGVQMLSTLDQVLRAKGLTFKVVGIQDAWKASFAFMRAAHLHGEGEP